MKDKIRAMGKGFLGAAALFTVFHAPLIASSYEEIQDYLTASIYELLGSYQFVMLPAWVCISFFFYFSDKTFQSRERAGFGLPVFFSLCLLIGNSFAEYGNFQLCFGSLVNFLKFGFCLAGYSFLFRDLMDWLYLFFRKIRKQDSRKGFWKGHVFRKAFLIISASYLPFLILSYPGNLCWDVIGQIEQVLGRTGYSTHHPLVHTLLVGNMVKSGYLWFGSYEIGLFFYVILQCLMLAAALAATLKVLERRGLPDGGLWGILVLYCITPVYTNVATTALKDVPFVAFVIGYVICLAEILESEEFLRRRSGCLVLAAMQLGVVLFRNNGMPLVVLTDLGILLYMLRAGRKSGTVKRFALTSLLSVAGAKILVLILASLLNAASGSKGEMLSIPLQQTARYLQLYKAEIDPEERAAIENLLGDVDEVAAAYDPTLSDPVKALYRANASLGDLTAYFGAWIRGFFNHPMVYVEAFLTHIYGWFDPAVSTAIRYEADYDLIPRKGLFTNADKLLIFYYRFADRISLLGALQNVGFAVWALFLLSSYQKKTKTGTAYRVMNLPLWISLLICVASPCFLNHPRYAFPILFTLPFLYGFTLTGNPEITEKRN